MAQQWLESRRLSRDQTQRFLTTTLLKLVDEVLPEL
jgi:hypothetical protein